MGENDGETSTVVYKKYMKGTLGQLTINGASFRG